MAPSFGQLMILGVTVLAALSAVWAQARARTALHRIEELLQEDEDK